MWPISLHCACNPRAEFISRRKIVPQRGMSTLERLSIYRLAVCILRGVRMKPLCNSSAKMFPQ